ncbi:MAG: hypothetical protein GX595_21135 [Lentisphaerae bacterium]|nr:hypothetical protein [Lentisphaerota bacterium]
MTAARKARPVAPPRAAAVAALVLITALAAAAGPAVDFEVVNPSRIPARTIATLSLPLPAGGFPGEPPAQVLLDGSPCPAQARVLSRHPDGSPRRVMLAFPVDLGPGQRCRGRYEPSSRPATASAPAGEALTTGAWTVTSAPDHMDMLAADGRLLARLTPVGPADGTAATSTVIDSGAFLTWHRHDRPGPTWGRQVDVQVSRDGNLRLTHRLQAMPAGDHWTPDFGWAFTAPGARLRDTPEGTRHALGRDPDAAFDAAEHADLIATVTLADGSLLSLANPMALRQNRGTFTVRQDDQGVTVESRRTEPVDDLETQGLMIQEGAWRFTEIALAPEGRDAFAARLAAPVYGHAAWQAYDAVYRTGPPLAVTHPVLRTCADRFVMALQDMQMKGDDLGSMPWSWSPNRQRRDYTSPVRLNHCLYVWEDWFRGGDPRLRQVAHDWCRNYADMGLYWGPNPDLVGACRRGNAWRNRPGHGPGTFNPRFNTTALYVHKGWSTFWLMYEETGDPRYRHAALAAAAWSLRHQHAGLSYTRVIGAVIDAVKLAEYTGDRQYLDLAQRLWESFQPTLGPDLLFTESGRPAVGNDLYIGSDAVGVRNPFVKPYIVQYATNALPLLLRHRPDDSLLRQTILALNDWMGRVQQPGGGWGYPHAATAGVTWNLEYAHGILLAYEVEPRPAYLDAVARVLRPTVQLSVPHGWPAAGLNPWEMAAGINLHQRQERYALASDRDPDRDYDEGTIRFDRSPDTTVYAHVVLRDYLRHRPEASLFESDPILERLRRRPAVGLPATAPTP